MRHFKDLLKAIDLERKAQKDLAIEEIRNISGEKRERLGRAILNLRGRYVGRELGDLHVVKFGRSRIIDTEIDIGDVVLVSRGNPLKSDLTGTVVSKTSRSITVAFDSIPPRWVLSKGIRIDLFYNDVTFKRMEKAVKEVMNGDSKLKHLVLLKLEPSPAVREGFEPLDTELNEFQLEAVALALGSSDFFLVHGPPGTGKTRTLTEYIIQEVRRGKRVAASADSNAAVDNLLKNLVDRGINAVRIGHPARVERELVERTLQVLVTRDPRFSEVEKIRKRVEELIALRDSYVKPEPKFRRGLSDEEIKKLAGLGRGTRGVSPKIISSMARWIEINENVKKLVEEYRALENSIAKDVLGRADVVLGTNSSFGMDVMEGEKFDVLVIDEATQSTEPSCLIPMVLSKKWVMAGDHKQLPPTVVSLEAEGILSVTLFERLIERFPSNSITLRIQYRMNEKIMEFPSKTFYNGLLVAHESVKDRTLEDLGFDFEENGWLGKVLNPSSPLVLIDTSKRRDRWERQRVGSTSRENPLEAKIVVEIVRKFLEKGIYPEMIGVITPYDDQVDLIKKGLENVKVSTVDGFQGREKEVIIVSFVRSNREKELGFLEDLRRLNVSLTRAKVKLVLIGDFSTLSRHEIYASLRKYVSEKGEVVLK